MPMHNPCHPGRILQTELEGRDLEEFARSVGITPVELDDIMSERASISPELSERLSKVLHTSANLWHRMQVNFDEWKTSQTSQAH